MCVRRAPSPTTVGAAAAYAQRLAAGLTAQGIEVDNLGDNESVVLTDACPTINLNQLAEYLLEEQDIPLGDRLGATLSQEALATRLQRSVMWVRQQGESVTWFANDPRNPACACRETWKRMQFNNGRLAGYQLVKRET